MYALTLPGLAMGDDPTGLRLDDAVNLDYEMFSGGLMQDEPEELRRLIFGQLTPQPGHYLLDALDVDGIETLGVPITYLLTVG